MKKISIILWIMLFAISTFAQTTTNVDGTLKFRGNVAIFVDGHSFTFQNGSYVKQVDDDTMVAMKTALRILSLEKFLNMSFSVVNRDDEASEQVAELIRTNKLEDYLDGLSIAAKGQGADYLFLVDVTNYGEDNVAAQFEVSTRLINVENNLGYHTFYRSEAMLLRDEDDMQMGVNKIVRDFSASLEEFLLNIFPEQYFVAKADGKTWFLGAYQPNGRILESDKFYAFRFQKENIQLGQNLVPIQVLRKVSTCKTPVSNGGYIQVKSDNTASNFSDIVLFRNLSQPIFQGANQLTMTFFGLDYDTETFDGLTKKRINNAVFSAITRHPGLQLVEHDHLSDLQKERELQKGEDFIDGHVVDQMKAIGAMYLLHLESYERIESQVTFKLSLISVANNQIIREVEVKTSIDNIENEMYKQICDRVANPCSVKIIDKNTLEMSSIISLREGDNCILSRTTAVKNPMTGEVSYLKANVCTLTVKEYGGNKCILSIDKILDKSGMENLEESSTAGLITFCIDGSKIRSNLDIQSGVNREVEKQDKGKNRKSIWDIKIN